jgi:AcrR family transcriptional regulator
MTTARKSAAAPAGPEPEESAPQRLIAAAERLFAERGFNGVSVREIAAAAGVNPAGVAYYFRGKEGLLAEVYRRHCQPMTEERYRLLAAACARGRPPALAEVLEAFIRPALRRTGDGTAPVTRLRAVLAAENSELLDQLVAENFDSSSARFIDALAECLPHLSRDDLYWRFHFLLGTVSYTASGPHRIRMLSRGRCDPADADAVIRELVPFAVAGLTAPPAAAPPRRRRGSKTS